MCGNPFTSWSALSSLTFPFKVFSTWNISKESRKLAGYGCTNCNSSSWEVGARAEWVQIHFYTMRFCVRKGKGEWVWEGSARAEGTIYCFSEEEKEAILNVLLPGFLSWLFPYIASKTSSCQWALPAKASYKLQTYSVDKGERALYMKNKQQFISLQMVYRCETFVIGFG